MRKATTQPTPTTKFRPYTKPVISSLRPTMKNITPKPDNKIINIDIKILDDILFDPITESPYTIDNYPCLLPCAHSASFKGLEKLAGRCKYCAATFLPEQVVKNHIAIEFIQELNKPKLEEYKIPKTEKIIRRKEFDLGSEILNDLLCDVITCEHFTTIKFPCLLSCGHTFSVNIVKMLKGWCPLCYTPYRYVRKNQIVQDLINELVVDPKKRLSFKLKEIAKFREVLEGKEIKITFPPNPANTKK